MADADAGSLYAAIISDCQLLLDAAAIVPPAAVRAVSLRIANDLPNRLLDASSHQFQLAHHSFQPIAAPAVALAQMVAAAFRLGLYRLERRHAGASRESIGGSSPYHPCLGACYKLLRTKNQVTK